MLIVLRQYSQVNNSKIEYVLLVHKQTAKRHKQSLKLEDMMNNGYKKGFLGGLLVLTLLTTACGRQENADLQQQSEQATEAYKKTLEAEGKVEGQLVGKEEYKLPTRPDEPDAILTIKDVQAMTTPEQLAKALAAPDAAVRLAAVQGLNAFSGNLPDAALQRLMNMLEAESDPSIVPAIAKLLGNSCHPAVMVMLLNNLKRDVTSINIEALKVLGDVAGYRAVEGIEMLLERLDDGQATPTANVVRSESIIAKDKILARNGRPLLCAW